MDVKTFADVQEAIRKNSRRRESNYMMVARFHTMTPESAANLDRFFSALRLAGAFQLTAALMDDDGQAVAALGKIRIKKTSVHVRQAWEIGQHDPDSICLGADDEVVVPEGAVDVPFQRLKAWFQELERGKLMP